MELELMNINSTFMQKYAVSEIIKCNDFTYEYGLTLTSEQAVELIETRTLSLDGNGRIEFRGGIIDKIIKKFCSSPYISMSNYTETLNELIEIFYYYKNETWDLMSDDDLIDFMVKAFDGVCQGSLNQLSTYELDKMAKNLRYGRAADYSEKEKLDKDEVDEYGQD